MGTLAPLNASPIAKRKRISPGIVLPAIGIASPAIVFYAVLFRQLVDIPWRDDDYKASLDFLCRMRSLHGTAEKASWFFASQHNEYKLFFAHAVVWLQLATFGTVDFRILCLLGDGFVLLLAILLWRMFLPTEKSLAARLTLFVPVSLMLFQLQYAETLNWAMPSLQNLPVLVFSLGGIYLLTRNTRRALWGAIVCLPLAVASSGNGLLLIPIGLLMLAIPRRRAALLAWLLVSSVCVAAYAYRYNLMSSQSPVQADHSLLATLHHISLLYVVTFIGSAGSFPIRAGGLVLGIALCLVFLYAAARGYPRRNPAAAFCVLFLLLTACGVAGLRSDFGLEQSLSSRYAIYSALLLIFAWMFLAEQFLQAALSLTLRRTIVTITIVAGIVFCLAMDVMGGSFLMRRHDDSVKAMVAYEHQGASGGPIPPVPFQTTQETELRNQEAAATLAESIRLSIYHPPAY